MAQEHDKLFKYCLQNHDAATDLLQTHLPSSLCKRINFSTLKSVKQSFVDKHLRERMSDVIFSVKFLNGDTGFVYLLIEHQSSADRFLPLRLFQYANNLLLHYIKNNTVLTLPVVVPLVFYNGQKSPYPYPLKYVEQFADMELAESVMTSAVNLIDIKQQRDDSSGQSALVNMMMLMLKYVKARNWHADLIELISLACWQRWFAMLDAEERLVMLNYLLKRYEGSADE